MEDKPLTESINKQYSKYGSLRTKEKESRFELCNAEDPMKFLSRIDLSIKDVKAKVKQSIANSTISEEYESSYDNPAHDDKMNTSSLDSMIPMVKLDRINKAASNNSNNNNSIIQQANSNYYTNSNSDLGPSTSTSNSQANNNNNESN